MLSQEDIFTMLRQGKSEDEIAEIITASFNSTVAQYKEEVATKARREQEKKERAEAATQVRNELIQALNKYLEFNNIEVKGDLAKWIERVEKKELPFPFMNFFDLIF